jgi:ABC-type molybdate transport system ATPase subunit
MIALENVTVRAGAFSLSRLSLEIPTGQYGVLMGRALSAQPRILCLDEPLGCLDEDTHGEVCELLKRVRREVAVTTLHVTHSMSEAKKLADCMFRIQNGAISRVTA